MWWWDGTNPLFQKSLLISQVIHLLFITLFLSTNTHFKKKINSPKISVKKEKKKSVTAATCKGKN